MARDYKSRSTANRKGSSIWSGILIGLMVGLVVAAAVAIWVGRSNPFDVKEPVAEKKSAPENTTKSDKPGEQIIDPLAKTTDQSDADKPRFDFYKILPGQESPVVDQKATQAQAAKVEALYYLQAGAFPNAEDADNLKARLALMGYEASIQTAEIPDKGVWHRVRLGPYKTDEANKIRDDLAQNKIQASLVKKQEPN